VANKLISEAHLHLLIAITKLSNGARRAQTQTHTRTQAQIEAAGTHREVGVSRRPEGTSGQDPRRAIRRT